VFILAGGPWVEASRARLGWTVPLQAITCAVIGVIAHLGWTFAHTLAWPAGPQGRLDGPALVLLAFAVWALWRAQWGALPLLGACAGLGLLASWLGLT
jgi:chromate transporter